MEISIEICSNHLLGRKILNKRINNRKASFFKYSRTYIIFSMFLTYLVCECEKLVQHCDTRVESMTFLHEFCFVEPSCSQSTIDMSRNEKLTFALQNCKKIRTKRKH